jgi:hypothetical protein
MTAWCTRHGTGSSATAAGSRDGCRNGKSHGQVVRPSGFESGTALVTNRAPFVLVGRGIQDLTRRTTGSADRRQERRLDRRNRGRNDAADGGGTNLRQINRTATQGPDLAVNATTDARCVSIGQQKNGESKSAEQSHFAASVGPPWHVAYFGRDTISIILPSSSSGALALARA